MKKEKDPFAEILKVVKAKRTGETGVGEGLYSNLSESDLKEIVSLTVKVCVSEIRNSVEAAADEWEVDSLLQQSLESLQNNLVIQPKKKLKP